MNICAIQWLFYSCGNCETYEYHYIVALCFNNSNKKEGIFIYKNNVWYFQVMPLKMQKKTTHKIAFVARYKMSYVTKMAS